MEKQGFDINFFIGIFLIFALLWWWNIQSYQSTVQEEEVVDTVDVNPIQNVDSTVLSDTGLSMTTSTKNSLDKVPVNYSLSNDNISIHFSNFGAVIEEVTMLNYQTHDNLPLALITDFDFDFKFDINGQIIHTNQLYFIGDDSEVNKLKFYWEDADKNSITLIYQLLDGYQLTCDVLTNVNDSRNNFVEPLNLMVTQQVNQLEKHLDTERSTTTIKYCLSNNDISQMPLMRDKQKMINEKVNWVAHRQQFFSTIFSSEESFNAVDLAVSTPETERYVKTLSSNFEFVDKGNSSLSFDFYFLPNKYSLLQSFEKDFESLVPLGWGIFGWVNKWLIIPMFNILEKWGLNYGLIILIIAFVIKMLLFLPTKSSYLSMAKMRVLKPEIDAINEKIDDPMERQQAHMNLYKKTGVNPLGGCLPLLFQMPILIALFRFFPSSIELRQQSFLWADDLSTYDSVLDLGFSIPFYGDHVSLFALLMTFATVLQMRYSNQSASNTQMPQMKYIMYFMPVIFLFVMNNYSAALSYYYFLANMITFGQQLLIRRSIDDDALYAQLQANKKKPVQKSRFQKKLEEMSKQHQKRR